MKITNQMSDEQVLQVLGERLTRVRLEKNRTQGEVAEEAGVGLRTLQRLESGEAATHLSGFIRVCRALGLADRLDALVPEPVPSPIERLKLMGKARKRASGGKGKPDDASAEWTWGESS